MTIDDIRRAAGQQGISRKELAKRAGVSQGTLSSVFSGKTAPSAETLQKLQAVVFGTADSSEPELIPRYSPHLLGPVSEALGIHRRQLRKEIQRGRFAWAKAYDFSNSRYTYLIDRKVFRDEYGITLEIPARKKEVG